MRRNWKAIIVLLAGLFTAGLAWGTAQEPDILLIDGKEVELNTNPLAAWIKANPGRMPEGHAGFTSKWRGYIATFEVAKGKLWLRKVGVRFNAGKAGAGEYELRDVLPQLFPDRREVIADWYTGTLIVPKGKLVEYVHMGYGSTWERYLVVWVDKGEVRKQLELSAAQFIELRKERFKAFQKTAAYRESLAQLRENADDPDERRIVQFIVGFDAEPTVYPKP